MPLLKRKELAGPEADANGTPYRYMVVVDAGSKGSRIYVYAWLENGTKGLWSSVDAGDSDDSDDEDSHGDHSKQGLSRPATYTIHSKADWHKSIKPGLAHTPVDSVSKYLHPLLKRAKKVVPARLHSSTPIYLHATGGVRLLPPQEQQALLYETCRAIREDTQFQLGECSEHITVIDGETEGVYGWLAANYLLDTINTETTTGFLDMGGASTQIAFVPPANEAQEHQHAMVNVNLGNTLHDVYLASFLGFGLKEARDKYLHNVTGADPCTPKDTPKKYRDSALVPAGNYTQCMSTLFPLLDSNSTQCDVHANILTCMVDDLFPLFDASTARFVGVSGYFHTIFELMGASAPLGVFDAAYDYDSVAAQAAKVCNAPWGELAATKVDKDKLADLCFRSTWVLSVLHSGLGLPHYDTENKGMSGLLLVESIHGHHFSWTLGRAVLYQASEQHGRSVGYTVNGTFVPGGGAGRESPAQESSWRPHRGSGGLILLVMVCCVGYLLVGRGRREQLKNRVRQLVMPDKYRRVDEEQVEMNDFIISDDEIDES